jgi:hypothetical protein
MDVRVIAKGEAQNYLARRSYPWLSPPNAASPSV